MYVRTKPLASPRSNTPQMAGQLGLINNPTSKNYSLRPGINAPLDFKCVGDSPRGPLKQLGNPHLKPATKPKTTLLNHAGHDPRREGPGGPPGGPLEDSLE
jgi:hypothetical protein